MFDSYLSVRQFQMVNSLTEGLHSFIVLVILLDGLPLEVNLPGFVTKP